MKTYAVNIYYGGCISQYVDAKDEEEALQKAQNNIYKLSSEEFLYQLEPRINNFEVIEQK